MREKLDCGGARAVHGELKGPFGPHPLCLNLNSELPSIQPAWAKAGLSAIRQKRQRGAKRPAVQRVFAEGAGAGAGGWRWGLALVSPSLSDEAQRAQPSQGDSGTAHLCMFYNGVDKIPTEPWSMCEEFPPEI